MKRWRVRHQTQFEFGLNRSLFKSQQRIEKETEFIVWHPSIHSSSENGNLRNTQLGSTSSFDLLESFQLSLGCINETTYICRAVLLSSSSSYEIYEYMYTYFLTKIYEYMRKWLDEWFPQIFRQVGKVYKMSMDGQYFEYNIFQYFHAINVNFGIHWKSSLEHIASSLL